LPAFQSTKAVDKKGEGKVFVSPMAGHSNFEDKSR
jgi:hypothetical protein